MPAMCASCVAQGAVYVGGALTGLQVMAARARARRRADAPGSPDSSPDAPPDTAPDARPDAPLREGRVPTPAG